MRIFRIFLLLLLPLTTAKAFPPAPYYTLLGMVRDQVGQTVTAEGAEILLLKGTEIIARTPVSSAAALDQNYELKIRLDTNRANTQLYTDKAIAAQEVFSLAVEMNGQRFYPIEASGTLKAGKGGERVRLDLNLGEDTDGDGLPDVWEQWQLYQSGHSPGPDGWDLSLLSRDGDFDHDGLSDWLEYVAGTFAGDAMERFDLAIKEKTAAFVRLEFYAITGKTYTIERSTDLKTWSRAPFALTEAAEKTETLTAAAVAVRPAFVTPGSAAAPEFYRLTVR
ncbi:MAG: hypothetical protein V4726_23450 [Verrucomicrobiota bacterium]